MKSLHRDTSERIHDAQPFIIIPHSKFTNDYVDSSKIITVIFGIVTAEDGDVFTMYSGRECQINYYQLAWYPSLPNICY